MHARKTLSVAFRIAVAMLCLFVTWRSIRIARADWLANGDLADLQRAIRMELEDGNLLALAAIYRSGTGDQSPGVDQDLQRAAQLNPLDSRVPMTQGLRAEFRGDPATAEKYLLRAVDLDKQFKPSWTLANFYLRRNQVEKIWPLLRHCLELDPLGFDPDPVFDLAWNLEDDPAKVLALVPKRNPRLIQYLSYLVRTNRAAAAAGVWAAALAVADAESDLDLNLLRPLPGFLAHAGHTADALRMWNKLVDRGMIHAGHLDPSRGFTLADPDFRFDLTGEPFGWVTTETPGAFSSNVESAFRFELDGNEPEAFELLHTTAAVLPQKTYNLRWEADGAQLKPPQDTGFEFRVTLAGSSDTTPLRCPPLFGAKDRSCSFQTGESSTLAAVVLVYQRTPGTTRPAGVFRLKKVTVEPAR